MSATVTLNFNYNGNTYLFLARTKVKDFETEYHTTVMNGTLEKMLHGNHIIKVKNGNLLIEILQNDEQQRLKLILAEALSKFLDLPLANSEKVLQSGKG